MRTLVLAIFIIQPAIAFAGHITESQCFDQLKGLAADQSIFDEGCKPEGMRDYFVRCIQEFAPSTGNISKFVVPCSGKVPASFKSCVSDLSKFGGDSSAFVEGCVGPQYEDFKRCVLGLANLTGDASQIVAGCNLPNPERQKFRSCLVTLTHAGAGEDAKLFAYGCSLPGRDTFMTCVTKNSHPDHKFGDKQDLKKVPPEILSECLSSMTLKLKPTPTPAKANKAPAR
jgi:hypothetical protein